MKILSLFDGISVAQQALKELGVKNVEYLASEIDEYALQITQKNFPKTDFYGDVRNLATIKGGHRFDNIDLLIGGSPCQDLSIAKKNREGLKGKRSSLFYEFVRLKETLNPKWFVLENVNSMPKEAKDTITKELGVEPIMINASLVSAQNRKRLFWTNIPNIQQPEDRGILLKDILEEGVVDREKSYAIDANYFKGGKVGGTHQSSKRNYTIRLGQIGKGGQGDRIYSPEGKSVNLSANGGGRGAKTGLYAVALRNRGEGKKPEIGGNKANAMTTVQTDSMVLEDTIIRKLTPIECERLQSLPDNYTAGVSNSQRYKALGNAFNCEVIKHILKNII
jgi:DNA (cytosine-5)-methyltransferase 3A